MNETLLIYWETYCEFFSNELMIHNSQNLLRAFEDEFIDGPILDLGCGQSSFLVEYSKLGKEIFAVDNEDFQLEKLKERIETYAGKNVANLNLLNLNIPEQEIPDRKFSIVIMSHFLHFFSLKDCKRIIDQIISRTQKGSFIYVKVHSQLHSYNECSDPGIKSYFKHFFTENDLNQLFDTKHFERIIYSDTQQSVKSKYVKKMETKWVEKVLDKTSVFDLNEREELIESNTEDLNVACLVGVYRRK